MGFQHMRQVVHEAASRKGGKVRKPKGLKLVSPEKLKEITSMGGKASAENYRSKKGTRQSQESSHTNEHILERILGVLDEKKL